MGEFQPMGAEHLIRQSQPVRKSAGFLRAVLWVAQNGEAHIGAVYPQLVGAACHRAQRKLTDLSVPVKHLKFRHGGLTLGGDLPQKAGKGQAGQASPGWRTRLSLARQPMKVKPSRVIAGGME